MIEWKLLRYPLIALVAALFISGSIWTWASTYNEEQGGVVSRLESDYTRTKQRYNEARRDRALYKQYLDSFLQYRNEGILGEEQRLSWIEELEEINKQLKLSALRYEIEPQSAAELSGMKVPGGIKLNSSTMKLTAGALHEGDVLYLLTELRKRARGYFAVKGCNLSSRVDQNGGLRYQPSSSYVNMECNLEWYTIKVQS